MIADLNEKHYILFGALGCSLAFNLVYYFEKNNESSVPTNEISEQEQEIDLGKEDSLEEGFVEQEIELDDRELSPDWKVLRADVENSLSYTFVHANSEHGSALSAVYSRLVMWDLNMRKDLMRGDQVEVVYRIAENGIPDVLAARYHSRKSSKTYSAFRYQAQGDNHPSFWAVDGTEAARRLKNAPLNTYEQITSLLKDRPTHKGMDFKVAVGTETTTPKSGTVTRVNWGNFKYNGYCVEVKFSDGTLAKWLHLDKAMVKKGQYISAGSVVGLTGNTGRSTAPHLHYQLDKGRKNIDPVDYHGTYRRRLSDAVIGDFLRDIAPAMRLLDGADSMADK